MKSFIVRSSLAMFCLTAATAWAYTDTPGLSDPGISEPGPGGTCNTQGGWIYATYNGKPTCVRCNTQGGQVYAKYKGKDYCVYCNPQAGWKYDGNSLCVKK